MKNLDLAQSEIDTLRFLHKQIKDKNIAYKINAIILLAEGYSYQSVEKALLLDERTIRRFRDIYLEKGTDGLLENNYKGRQTKLSKEQEDELAKHLEENLYATASEICNYIKKKYKIEFTPDGLVITLHRLGFSYKKTKIVPSKADKELQEKFVKEYENLRNNQKSDEKVYFLDGVHPSHNVMPAYGWIKKGKEKEVKSNTGRQRININGVYSPDDGEIIIRDDESINAQSTIELFKTIEAMHPELSKIYIIRDNARYYTSKVVTEYLQSSRIEVIPLPSYSPNLNLIERLWKFFKKKVLYNKYYSTYLEFKNAVFAFFGNCQESYKEELTSLMTENFHIFQL